RVDNLRGGGSGYTGPGVQDYTRGGNRGYTRDSNRAYTGPGDTGTPHGEEDDTGEDSRNEQLTEPVKSKLSKLRTAPSISKQSVPTVLSSDSLQEDEARPPLSALIDRIVADYSARLHDQEKNTRSNCTRARRLWASSE